MKLFENLSKTSTKVLSSAYDEATSKASEFKSLSMDKDNRLVQMALNRYRKVLAGKRNAPMGAYLKEINKTEGNYSRRSSDILYAVKYAADYIAKSQKVIAKDNRYGQTPVAMFTGAMEILNEKKWIMAFNKAFGYQKKQKRISPVESICLMYNMLALSVESMIYFLKPYENDLLSGDKDIIISAYMRFIEENYAMVKHLFVPTIHIVVELKKVKDPLKFINNLIKSEKEGLKASTSQESEGDTYIQYSSNIIPEELHNKLMYSEESAGVVMVVALIVSGILVLIPALRALIYYIGYWKVNIAENIREDIEILTHNIDTLEDKRDKAKTDRDREHYDMVIAKQKDWVAKLEEKRRRLRGETVSATRDSLTDLDEDERLADNYVKEGGSSSDEIFL